VPSTAPCLEPAIECPAEQWHALTPDEVARRWQVDPARGLAAPEAAARLARHGPNALPEPPPRPAWRRFARQLGSPLVALLFVAAALAVALGHLADAAVILAVVLANTAIGGLQEGRAERSMAALRRLAALRARVLRDGAEQSIEAHALVPGDVLLLDAGDAVGADARLVVAAQLQVAQAALTGESVPVDKAVAPTPDSCDLADRQGMVHAGTHVAAGRGRAIIVATGARTEVGRIAALTEAAPPLPTPLERRVARFGRAQLLAALAVFAAVMLLGWARSVPLPELLMVAISQMVSMVPEGLPVAMTIALAVGMQRMAARGAIVRRLAAVETLGSTTVICSDKTGTLTQGEMTAVALWLPAGGPRATGRELAVEGSGYAPAGAIREQGQAVDAADAALAALLEAGALCNDAALLPPEDERSDWRALGDPTEAALLVLAAKGGLEPAALRARSPRSGELPFDARAKLMVTRHGQRILIKGAPEAVTPLLHDDPPAARAAADVMAARALRVLAFAAVDDVDAADHPELDGGLPALAGRARLLGLVGQRDPPRAEARAAVQACRAAGIRVLMVTGDHPATGLAIARELGIAAVGDGAVSGDEFERAGDAALPALLSRTAVFARVAPAQKLRLVCSLQAGGAVVAMTGDGVNDAPALAAADIGVAMGRSGTEVAKSAAGIVIVDDDFATIVAAVAQGRAVHADLKKVVLFLFATSVDEVLVLLMALAAGLPLPLLAVQILWINIVTESTLTLNLVMDRSDGRSMQRPPTPRDAPLLDRQMLLRAALMALVAAAVAVAWFALRLREGLPVERVRTELFTLVAVTQWFNAVNCRRSATRSAFARGWRHGSRWLAAGLALSVLLQAAVLYWPPLAALFHLQPLPASTLAAIVGAASAVLWAEELRKWVVRRRR
jgi:Ca2+-transporting ATPase